MLIDRIEIPFRKSQRVWIQMPSKEELEAIKAHLKKVDLAQESRLSGMFAELMSGYIQKEENVTDKSKQD